jgi:hypothetical protein
MKPHYQVSLLLTILLFINRANSQTGIPNATQDNINSRSSTMIIRSITREEGLSKDSIIITGHIYSVGCRPFKWSPNSIDFIYIDSVIGDGKLQKNSSYYFRLFKGNHKIITLGPENGTQWPYNSEKIFFKGGRRYQIDLFIAGRNFYL